MGGEKQLGSTLRGYFLLHWLAEGCVCGVIKCNKATCEQLSVLSCQFLMDPIRICGGGGAVVEIREVTPVVGLEEKTVLGSLETRAGGRPGDEMYEGQISPQLRGAEGSWVVPPPTGADTTTTMHRLLLQTGGLKQPAQPT